MLDALLIRLARRHRWQRILAVCAPRLVVSALLAAVVITTIRLAIPAVESLVSACVVAGLLAPLVWVPATWRVTVPRALLAGELDHLAAAEGLVMAYAEQRDAAWSERCHAALQRVRIPPLLLQPMAPACLMLALLGGAWCLPQVASPPPGAAPAEALVKPLREQLATLSDAGILTIAERKELDQRLTDLVGRSQGGALDQATWEGIDRLQTQLAAQTAAAGEKLAAAMAAAAAAADPSAAPGGDAGSEHAAALAAQMSADLAKLAEQAPGLVPANPADPAQRAALAQALERAQRQGLITPAQAAALQRAGLAAGKPGVAGMTPAQGRALARRLADELAKRKGGLPSGAQSAADAFLARLGQQSGGGPSRGPGEAPLDHLARTRTAGGDQAALTPGTTLNPDGSVTVAAQARDAQVDDAARAALQRAAARAFDPTAADSRRATVAPRHRAVVEAYFQEK